MTLFGSLARNEQHEGSDVDVCVDMVPNLFNRAGVKIYLQELLGCNVDVVRMRDGLSQIFKSPNSLARFVATSCVCLPSYYATLSMALLPAYL